MATATETYFPRLKRQYEEEIRPALKDELELDSIMRVPKVTKITLNMGVGDAKTDAKAMDAAIASIAFASVFASPTPMLRVIFVTFGTRMIESSSSSSLRAGRISASYRCFSRGAYVSVFVAISGRSPRCSACRTGRGRLRP